MIRIDEHAYKHGLTDEQILYAWSNPIVYRYRDALFPKEVIVMLGCLPDARVCELVACKESNDMWCIFHAMTPPTKKFIREVRGGSNV